MKPLFESKSTLLFAITLVLCASFGHSQVTVAIAPNLHEQFVDSSGQLLSNGRLWSYDAGTNNLRSTYVDSFGIVQNPDPIPLDASGAPTNGSTQTGIWLANQSYKFCAYNSLGVLQWCRDNVSGYLGLLNLPNTWAFQQTFTQPIIDTATDNQLVLGAPGNQTTADFPPPTGNVTLHFPSTTDTIPGRNTIDILLNKTLVAPVITTPLVNGVTIQNAPATYFTIANANPTGTTTNTLTILLNAPSQATIATTSTTDGVIGICVLGCGNTLTATIQQSGSVPCVFDGATTAGDFVGVSTTAGGDCHDIGASLATGALGRVLSTTAGGLATMDLFPQVKIPATSAYFADATTTLASANTNTVQPLKCNVFAPAGTLNQVGKVFRGTAQIQIAPGGGASNQTVWWQLLSGCFTGVGGAIAYVTTAGNAATVNTNSTITCVVNSTGVAGTLACSLITTSNIGTIETIRWTPTLDLTQSVSISNECQFSVASALNICNQDMLVSERLN